MTDKGIGLSRRKLLAGLGSVGLASAGAGVGTTALFGDEESDENDELAAGELDLTVGWREHYYNGGAAPDNGENVDSLRHVDDKSDVGPGEVGLPDPRNPVVAVAESDLETFMNASTTETGGPRSNPGPGPIELSDVKPGDFGEVTFSYRLLDNPGYVSLEAVVNANDENGVTEPEANASGEDGTRGSPGTTGELGDGIRAALWYDPDCDNVLDREEDPVVSGTLDEVLAFLGANPPDSGAVSRDPLVLDPTQSGGRVAPGYTGTHCHSMVDSSVDCSEKFYFTSVDDADGQDIFGSPDDDTTVLYEATLVDTDSDGRDDRAEITELFNFANEGWSGTYDHIVSIAASADGTKVYVIDKFSGHLGVYDVANGTFEDRGEISGAPNRSLQSAVSPEGTLYFTVGGGTNLYTIENPDSNNPTVDDTIPLTDSNGDTIEVGGSDIAFLSSGTLYLIDARVSDNTHDLYELPDPSTGRAEKVAELSSDVGMPGLAVRASGTGNLVGNDSRNDQFYELDPTDGSEVATYEMVEPGGAGTGFDQSSGDMTVGALCPTHCMALAWWVPRDAGNEIQGDSYEFDVTFHAEQCRNNAKLVNHWPLDSVDDGTAEDVVGGIDGAPEGGVSSHSGKVGTGAASFDGSGWIGLPGFRNVQSSFTVAAWIRTDDNTIAGQRIFADDENGTDGYALSLGDGGTGKLRLFSRALDSDGFNSIILDTGNVIQTGSWHHVVAVVDTDAKVRRIYVDGTEAANDSFSNEWGTDPGTASIGGTTDGSKGFDGAIDDVRFYDKALSDSAVEDLYNATK